MSLSDTVGLRGVPDQQGQEKIRHQALLWVLAAVSQVGRWQMVFTRKDSSLSFKRKWSLG